MYYLIVFYYYIDISRDNLLCITLNMKLYIKKNRLINNLYNIKSKSFIQISCILIKIIYIYIYNLFKESNQEINNIDHMIHTIAPAIGY